MPTEEEWVAVRGERLDVAVSSQIAVLSRSRAAGLIRDGAVRVDAAVVLRPASKVTRGQRIRVVIADPVSDRAKPQDLPLSIIHEDQDIAVVDKASGMVVHPSAGHADGTLVNALLHHISDLSGVGGVQRPGIVHRLDRGTSGLLVVAKNDTAHQALAGQFAAHTAGRTYLALVLGIPGPLHGTIQSHLGRHPKDRLRWASVDDPERGKRAVTHYRVEGRAGSVSLLSCRLETGRTHQIRVHLSEQGWPLVGDRLYKRRGKRLPPALARAIDADADRPMLHAWQLRLDHPRTGEAVRFVAPPPSDFRAALEALALQMPTAQSAD